MYEVGEGFDVNMKKAFQWYQTSAENGHAEGQFCLGRLYALGQEQRWTTRGRRLGTGVRRNKGSPKLKTNARLLATESQTIRTKTNHFYGRQKWMPNHHFSETHEAKMNIAKALLCLSVFALMAAPVYNPPNDGGWTPAPTPQPGTFPKQSVPPGLDA